ncbi:TonB-dependent receptor plug domain-containing protein [Sphingomonas cavernae]|uniref:TonB-dependent receptor n=1 Tax=Sphingomonas cavernae TaxID=2320861 RepID=A0A418W695_9SPHN|nr:TonB-dependent receptor [Sphingomonas cavernae]RJF85532.1 TonB-dependent receptor [Sphingomonas cavernae]
MNKKKLLLLGSALIPLLIAGPVMAETADSAESDEQVRASDIIVNGAIEFRNRTEDVNPVLSYDLEYFQRFEPVSVGEMLKRVPGVTFTSDVLEYDGVQMRGLPPGFTQVLINGRRAPGGEADGAFFVDRLPAELVERIELVRAPRADQPSDGIAGTLNVITKESATFEGGFIKGGMLINEDGGVRPSGAIAWAGRLSDSTSIWAGFNYQERRNPKEKVSYRFSGEPTTSDKSFPGNPATSNYITDPEFDNFEAQDDTRDGTDISGNIELTSQFGDGGQFRIGGLFVNTDRDEDETSVTLEGEDLDFDEVETQHEDIDQKTYAMTMDARVPLGFAELGLAAGWSGFREDTDVTVFVGDNADDFTDVELDDEDSISIKDDEFTGTISLTFGRDTPLEIKPGLDLLSKTRDGGQSGTFLESDFSIDENRYAPYVRATFKPSDEITVDAGLRYEITRRNVRGLQQVEDDNGDEIILPVRNSYNDEDLNPSLHLRYAPSANDQFRLSMARTVRRPNYDLISPIQEFETPGDDDSTIGNPELRNEKAWGVDLGYERRLGGNGIVGINFFYRDIKDLIEHVAIEDLGDGNLYTPRNIGDGQTWGIEIDFSAPLTVFGMPDTGLFANYTWLDSETTDPFTGEKRRFNNQPHHIYNAGFIQTVRSVDASFGMTISGRSKSLESNFDETISLRYDPDLEAFVEKRFGKNFVLRLSAQNLLNRVKKEDFRKYDGDSLQQVLDARAAGDLDEYEIERERAGRLFQVTLRAAF